MIKLYLCKVIEVMHFLIPNELLILYTYFNLITHEILDLNGINDAISVLLEVFTIIKFNHMFFKFKSSFFFK